MDLGWLDLDESMIRSREESFDHVSVARAPIVWRSTRVHRTQALLQFLDPSQTSSAGATHWLHREHALMSEITSRAVAARVTGSGDDFITP